jgi:hypothetical protein
LKCLRYINVFAHYRSQVCDLTYFSRLQTACPQPLPGNELLKTCNITQFFTVTYPSVAHILLTDSPYPVHHLRWTLSFSTDITVVLLFCSPWQRQVDQMVLEYYQYFQNHNSRHQQSSHMYGVRHLLVRNQPPHPQHRHSRCFPGIVHR